MKLNPTAQSKHLSQPGELIRKQQTTSVLVAQLCLTLWDPMDCSRLDSPVQGILQGRVLEWVAILFSIMLSGHKKPLEHTRSFIQPVSKVNQITSPYPADKPNQTKPLLQANRMPLIRGWSREIGLPVKIFHKKWDHF